MSPASVETATIPQELFDHDQWIVWKSVERDGKPTKVPYDAKSGKRASTTNASTWVSFDIAYTAYSTDPQWHGIGFVLSKEDPFVGVDLDDCIDDEGEIATWAADILDELKTYAEISPSGHGIKAIAKARLPEGRRRRGKIEMYDSERFFTITGAHIEDYPAKICKRGKTLPKIHAEYLGGREQPKKRQPSNGKHSLADDDLIQEIRDSDQAEKFERLWSGDIEEYDSHSEADLALCNILAFWTDHDAEAIDRLFRQSALYREKWDRASYREPTISEATGFVTESYQPDDGASVSLPISASEISTNGHVEQISEPVWQMPKAAPQIFVDDLPYWINRIVRHVEPFTPMFPPEWGVMVMLPYWSMLWPQVRIQNLNLALWTLGVGRQGGGKNIATDELERLTRAILQGDITMYTAGSPEGLWEALEGNGKRVLAYHDEYAGLLKLFSRDHMGHAKEALCSLYDGRGVGYLRTKGKSVQITDPVLAVIATTTPSALREYGNTSDLTNGYLSRFMVCAPDRRNISPDFSLANDMERGQLARELAAHRSDLASVARIEYAETGRSDPPAINAYRLHLGIDTGESETLEDALDDNSIPGGRLLARVKKIAALMALAERPPRTTSGGLTVLIEESHIKLAIDIVELGYYYANRVLSWIGESQDIQLSGRIYQLLRDNPHGLSRRQLCRMARARASEVQDALRLLREEGTAISARDKTGRTGERWMLVKQ